MSDGRTSSLVIRTPEGVAFSLILAGPVARFLAWLIDAACIWVLMATVGGILQLAAVISLDMGMALIVVANFIIAIGYGIAMEWLWRGQTIGKKVLRLRVMDAQGLRLHFSQVVIRNLLRFVDSLPFFYLTGGTACLVSRKGQRLGDLAANTIVIRHPEIFSPSLDRLPQEKYNSLRDCPHLAARLRQKVTGDQAATAMRALLRRDELDPQARISLFKELADHFRSVVEYPQEAVEGMTDERYVRNVVEVVYDSRRTRTGSRAAAAGDTDKEVA